MHAANLTSIRTITHHPIASFSRHNLSVNLTSPYAYNFNNFTYFILPLHTYYIKRTLPPFHFFFSLLHSFLFSPSLSFFLALTHSGRRRITYFYGTLAGHGKKERQTLRLLTKALTTPCKYIYIYRFLREVARKKKRSTTKPAHSVIERSNGSNESSKRATRLYVREAHDSQQTGCPD